MQLGLHAHVVPHRCYHILKAIQTVIVRTWRMLEQVVVLILFILTYFVAVLPCYVF